MKIPTHWKDQHALPWLKDVRQPQASNFQFDIGQGNGQIQSMKLLLSPEDEGRMLFFPAWLTHQVFPFYGTEEERITISGNIIGQETEVDINEKEKILEEMKKEVSSFEDMIKQAK